MIIHTASPKYGCYLGKRIYKLKKSAQVSVRNTNTYNLFIMPASSSLLLLDFFFFFEFGSDI